MMAEPQPARPVAILATLFGAVAVGAAAWVGVAFANGAHFWSPATLAMVLPAWWIGEALLGNIDAGPNLIPLMGAVLFLLLGFPLAAPRSKIVLPALLVGGLVTLSSTAYFLAAWGYGIEYQGFWYTLTLAVVNLGLAVLVAWLGWNALRLRTYPHRYAYTFTLCTWVVWFAFPWLGEMP